MSQSTATLTRPCASYCSRNHNERPDEVVVCESTPAYIPRAGSLSPISVQVSMYRDDADQAPEVYVGDDPFDLAGVQRLQRELAVAEQMLRSSHR